MVIPDGGAQGDGEVGLISFNGVTKKCFSVSIYHRLQPSIGFWELLK